MSATTGRSWFDRLAMSGQLLLIFARFSIITIRSGARAALGVLMILAVVAPFSRAAEPCESANSAPCPPVSGRLSLPAGMPARSPSAAIHVEPSIIRPGEIARLTWRATGGTKVLLNGEPVTPFGQLPVSPSSTTEYLLEITSPDGRAFASTILLVVVPPKVPAIGFIAEPDRVMQGEEVELIWSTESAENAWLDGEAVLLSGTRRVRPETTRSWELRAEGPGGSASRRVTVLVIAPPPPPPPPPPPTLSALPDRILFDFNEWVIREDGRDTLERVANGMRADPDLVVRLEGHTDGFGTREYNIALGLKRAISTRDFISASFGIAPTRFEIGSRGEEVHVAAERTPRGLDYPEGRQQNRRVVILEITPPSPLRPPLPGPR